MIKAEKLGHLVLNVSDLAASRDFYVKVCGFEVMAENEERKIVFLSLGDDHHHLALIQRATGPRPDATQPGLVHFAWRLEDFAAVQAAYKELTEAGIEIEPIQHNVTNSLYMKDPDGHLVELYCDRWGDKGMEVMRTQGPKRMALDVETGEAVGSEQELLPVR
jgi:catechol 2,3-dioxygenase